MASSYERISTTTSTREVIEANETRRQTIAKFSILVVLTLERLAYYSLSANFILFLNEGPWNKVHSWNTVEALSAEYFLVGISYLSALFGGYISDSCLGRFKSIVVGFLLYIAGFVLLTLISIDKLPRGICNEAAVISNVTAPLSLLMDTRPEPPCKSLMYISLSVIGIGTGIVKSNIAPFGAEQLRTANPQRLRSFFNWFYWCVNIGSVVAIGAVAFIEQDDPGICTNGFFCGYLIATICLCLALFIFVATYPWYYMSPPEGSVLGNIIKIVFEATKANFRNWRFNRQNPNLSPLHVEPAFLDRAKIRFGGSFHESAVDDVGALGKLLAVFCALIPYWIVCFQMETSFQVQGRHMRFAGVPHAPPNETLSFDFKPLYGFDEFQFTVPAAWLTLFNQAFLILTIPILTSFLYPRLDRSGVRLSLFFRIGLGMLFSTMAVMSAGGLESYRTYLWQNDNSTHIDQLIGNVTYHAVDISIFWQIPQYVLVGAAEAFANIAGLEFAYSAAPGTFQSLIMGLFYSLEGCASFLGSFLLQLVAPFWFNNQVDYKNINDNHLDFYLYFLGIIQFTTLAAFCTVLYVRRFTLKLVLMPPPTNIRRQASRESTQLTASGSSVPAPASVPEGERSDGDGKSLEDEDRINANLPEDERPLVTT